MASANWGKKNFANDLIVKFTFFYKLLLYIAYENYRIMTNKISKPTESELEILKILWQKEKATVRAVHEELALYKDAGYTTTLKLLQIMFDKGLVVRDDSSKVHVYEPNISQENAQKQFLPRFINNLFSGSPAQLVMQTLGNHNASEQELEEIQTLLNKLKEK